MSLIEYTNTIKSAFCNVNVDEAALSLDAKIKVSFAKETVLISFD